MGRLEQDINKMLQRFPNLKTKIKRVYQLGMYAISPKLKCEGDIERITPLDEYEYFFGYYDKSPWDKTGRYILCNRVRNAYLHADNDVEAQLVLIDTFDNNSLRIIAKTHCWNVQQGCMLQWLGPDYTKNVIYNDFRDGSFCAVILDVETGQERLLPMPVYSVNTDGKFALTLDFSRLHNLRPGYGYCNAPEETAGRNCPENGCIWRIDLASGKIKQLFTYQDLKAFETRNEMEGATHKVNHLMISPNGKRFMVLHRWILNGRKYTRLLTANCNGEDLYNLLDDDMVSHCCWKNDGEILTFAERKGEGRGYFLLNDCCRDYRHLWPCLVGDGHPTYGVSGRIVTDSYPDRRRVSNIYVLDDKKDDVSIIARSFSPFRYDNDVRCDLHPRWRRDGQQICFDGVFEGKRALYVVNINDLN